MSSNKINSKVTAVLWDVDGTLVDSNDAHAKAWIEALKENNFNPAFAMIRQKIGMGGDKLLPAVTGVEAASALGKQISQRRQQIFAEKYLRTLQPFPGARELLKRMLDDGLTLVVASSASADDLKRILEQTKLSGLFRQTVSSDDAKKSKPDPDILRAALQKIDQPPETAIMIGDTPYDLEAARRTRVRFVGFTSGGWDRVTLNGATEVYEGCQDLLSLYEASPFKKDHSH